VVSLFTGVYPQQHGVNKGLTIIPESLVTIQEILEKQGITTAAFITNSYLKPQWGYARGFRHYFDHYLQEFKEYVASRLFFFNAILHFKNWLLNPYYVKTKWSCWWSFGLPPFNHENRSAERVTNDVLKWIHTHRDKPFYIYLHYMDVHEPYDAFWYPLFDSEIYPSQSPKGKLINIYDGRIVYVDRQIHRIWEYLNHLNLSDKTLFIITADHGEELYDHKRRGHCFTLYEELIRVPLIMFNPSLSKIGQRVEEQVQLIDLPMTVLYFLNIKAPEQMNERSLLSLIIGSPRGSEPAYALSYTTRGLKRLRTKEERSLWKKKSRFQRVTLESLRVDNEWKIIVRNDGRTELYSLKNDKKEQNDLKEIEQLVLEDLKKELMEESSTLKHLTPKQEKLELSPDTRNKLRALGYL